MRKQVGAVALGIAAAVALGLSSAATASASPDNAPASLPTIRQAGVSALQAYLNQHTGQFADLYLESTTHTVYVDVASGSPVSVTQSLDRQIQADSASAGGPELRVVLRRVHYSHQQLAATMAAVTQRQPWASLSEPLLASWGIDPRSDTVVIGLTKLTAQLVSAARATFGDQASLVQQQRPNSAIRMTPLPPGYHTVKVSPTARNSAGHGPAVAPFPSRLTDNFPYYGGDRIYKLVTINGQEYVNECTVAFTWNPSGMTSAGHCGPLNTQWTQGYYDTSNNTLYTTGVMGLVKNVQWGNNRPDAELIKGATYSPSVYTGLQSHSLVGGPGTPYVGETSVCADGSFTGQNCKGKIDFVGKCVNEVDNGVTVKVCDLDAATSTDGSVIVQAGDSGGPVYTYLNGKLFADGVISASSNDLGNPVTEAGKTVYFTDIRNVISTMGGTVAKG
jgi:hypothetical protein